MSVLRKYNPTTEQWEILQGGVQGLQGPPVALSKGTVTTTAAGTNADFSITGTPPAQVLNLTLPRGEAGGWVNAAGVPSNTDANTLLVAGQYVAAIRQTAANNWPTDNWDGYLHVTMYGGYTLQVAYGFRGTTHFRSRTNTTWTPWRNIPRVGDLSLDIVGAGRPDIPASMTTEVAAFVEAATSGAKFRSTDGPQGAWEWQKRGASWVCVEGDTGWRNITTLILNGWTAAAGAIHIRRHAGSVVEAMARTIDGTAASSVTFADLPAGFRSGSNGRTLVTGPSGAAVTWDGKMQMIRAANVSMNAISSTTDPWPTTLPGTAV